MVAHGSRNALALRGVRIFVTQAYHLPRVLYLAQAEGIDAQGVAADAHPYPGLAWYQIREVVSRSNAVLDVLLGREPRFLGPPVDLGP
jgi:SanA protein